MEKTTLSNGYYVVKEDFYLFLYDSTEHLLASFKEHGWKLESMHISTARAVIEWCEYVDNNLT